VVDAEHPDIETDIEEGEGEQKVAALVTGSKINPNISRPC